MDELFRFVNLRPATIAKWYVKINDNTDLNNALGKSSSVKEVKDIINKYKNGIDFIQLDKLEDLKSRIKFWDFQKFLLTKEEWKDKDEIIAEFYDRVFVQDITQFKGNLADAILIMKYDKSENHKPLATVVELYIILSLIQDLKEGKNLTKEDIISYISSPIVLPDWGIALHNDTNIIQPNDKSQTISKTQIAKLDALHNQYFALQKASEEVMSVSQRHLELLRPVEVQKELPQVENDIKEEVQPLENISKVNSLVFGKKGYDIISSEAKSALRKSSINVKTSPFEQSINTVNQEKQRLYKEIKFEAGKLGFTEYIPFEGKKYPWLDPFEQVHPVILPTDQNPKPIGNSAEQLIFNPTSFNKRIKSVGVGDLLIVKQTLVGYEEGEISHIENIMAHEIRKRTFRSKKYSEQFISEETESIKEEERNLQSTENFELSKEVNEALKEKLNVRGSLKVQGDFGQVKTEVAGEVAFEKSSEIANKVATKYTKEIIDKASKKVTEKIKRQQTLKLINEIEETNEHGFENTQPGATHNVGIYQWLNKVYEVKILNYGNRFFYDVMIPEPSKYLKDALKQQLTIKGLKEPVWGENLKATSINNENYIDLLFQYGIPIMEIPMYPQEFVKIVHEYKGEYDAINGKGERNTIEAPNGYKIVSWSSSSIPNQTIQILDIKGSKIEINGFVMGSGTLIVGQTDRQNRSFTNEDGVIKKLSIGLMIPSIAVPNDLTLNKVPYSIGLEFNCQRTDLAIVDWQIKLFILIKQSYQKQLSEYKLELAKLLNEQNDIRINPNTSKSLEINELKKACISTFIDRNIADFGFNGFEIANPNNIDFQKAEEQGKFIRFFEQAFEWENMSYAYYPYYWAREGSWIDKILENQDDYSFGEFLKAGAARVLIPVRKNFDAHVGHFFQTGETWSGGELPLIGSPDFINPINESIKEQQKGKQVGETFCIRIPTQLVKLRKENEEQEEYQRNKLISPRPWGEGDCFKKTIDNSKNTNQ